MTKLGFEALPVAARATPVSRNVWLWVQIPASSATTILWEARAWTDTLFENDSRMLREPVYFWARAWREDDTGPFYGFETSLEALEYYLIDLASDLYPEHVLNTEGV